MRLTNKEIKTYGYNSRLLQQLLLPAFKWIYATAASSSFQMDADGGALLALLTLVTATSIPNADVPIENHRL
jgi:hypothetical protein